MRNLLALIGLVVVVVGGAGWYLGWYKLNVSKSSDGNLQITIDADTKKATADFSDLTKNVGGAISNHVDKAAQDAKAPNTAPGVTPGPINPPQNLTPNPVPLPPIPSVPVAPVAPPTRFEPIPLKAPGQN